MPYKFMKSSPFYPIYYHLSSNTSGLREPQSGGRAQLVDNILALEEDISEDAESDTSVILDASVAGRRSSS
jgi:hypothetical protein